MASWKQPLPDIDTELQLPGGHSLYSRRANERHRVSTCNCTHNDVNVTSLPEPSTRRIVTI